MSTSTSQSIAGVTWTTWWRAFIEGYAVIFGPRLHLTLACLAGILALGAIFGLFTGRLTERGCRLSLRIYILLSLAAALVTGISAATCVTGEMPTVGAFFTRYSLVSIYCAATAIVYVVAMLIAYIIGLAIESATSPRNRRWRK